MSDMRVNLFNNFRIYFGDYCTVSRGCSQSVLLNALSDEGDFIPLISRTTCWEVL